MLVLGTVAATYSGGQALAAPVLTVTVAATATESAFVWTVANYHTSFIQLLMSDELVEASPKRIE